MATIATLVHTNQLLIAPLALTLPCHTASPPARIMMMMYKHAVSHHATHMPLFCKLASCKAVLKVLPQCALHWQQNPLPSHWRDSNTPPPDLKPNALTTAPPTPLSSPPSQLLSISNTFTLQRQTTVFHRPNIHSTAQLNAGTSLRCHISRPSQPSSHPHSAYPSVQLSAAH